MVVPGDRNPRRAFWNTLATPSRSLRLSSAWRPRRNPWWEGFLTLKLPLLRRFAFHFHSLRRPVIRSARESSSSIESLAAGPLPAACRECGWMGKDAQA